LRKNISGDALYEPKHLVNDSASTTKTSRRLHPVLGDVG